MKLTKETQKLKEFISTVKLPPNNGWFHFYGYDIYLRKNHRLIQSKGYGRQFVNCLDFTTITDKSKKIPIINLSKLLRFLEKQAKINNFTYLFIENVRNSQLASMYRTLKYEELTDINNTSGPCFIKLTGNRKFLIKEST